MRPLFAPLVAGLLLVTAPIAHAADAAGAIKTINTTQRNITMEDGKVYSVPGTMDLAKIKVGDRVKITYVPSTPIWKGLGIDGFIEALAPGN